MRANCCGGGAKGLRLCACRASRVAGHMSARFTVQDSKKRRTGVAERIHPTRTQGRKRRCGSVGRAPRSDRRSFSRACRSTLLSRRQGSSRSLDTQRELSLLANSSRPWERDIRIATSFCRGATKRRSSHRESAETRRELHRRSTAWGSSVVRRAARLHAFRCKRGSAIEVTEEDLCGSATVRLGEGDKTTICLTLASFGTHPRCRMRSRASRL